MNTNKVSKKDSTDNTEKKKHGNYYVGGEKGGVGKSFFTRCLIDFFLNKGWGESFILIDADQSINDVISVYPGKQYQTIRFSDDRFDQDAPDAIVNCLADKTVVVNLPSNISLQFDSWVKKIGLLTPEFAKYSNSTVYFFVTDGSYQSILQFLAHLEKYQSSTITNCLVFNPGRLTSGGDFRYLEKECPEFLKALKNIDIPVIQLPILTSTLQFRSDRSNIPYRELLQEKLNADKINASSFLSALDTLFDKIFSQDISSPVGLTAIAKERRPYHEKCSLSYLYKES